MEVLEVEPVNNSEGKYVRELSKKAENDKRYNLWWSQKELQEQLFKPEDGKLTDIFDQSEEEEEWEEKEQPRGFLHWLRWEMIFGKYGEENASTYRYIGR